MSKTIIQLPVATGINVTDIILLRQNGSDKQMSASGVVITTGEAQTVSGVKTFASIPTLPAISPTGVNQATRKKYVDEKIYKSLSVSGDTVISDNDGYTDIFVTTGASNVTITLPTLADNLGRSIKIIKVDSGTGSVICDGEGTEKINEVETIHLTKQFDYIDTTGITTHWQILSENISCQLRLDTYAGYGSTDTKIMRFTNSRDNYGNCFSENHSSGYNSNADGLEITINKSGIYTFSLSCVDDSGVSGNVIGFSLNSTQLTTNINSINVQDRLNESGTTSADRHNVAWTGRLSAGDVVRVHGIGTVPNPAAEVHFTVTYL